MATNIKNKPTFIISISFILLVGFGCTILDAINNPGKLFDNTEYFGGDQIVKVVDEFKKKIGKPFRVRIISITKGVFKMEIENPDKPTWISKYDRVLGKIKGPKPGSGGITDEQTFPFDKINFSGVPKMLKEILTKSRLKNPKIKGMRFYRQRGIGKNQYKFTGKALWSVTVISNSLFSKDDDRVFAYAEPSGKILHYDFSKSQYGKKYDVLTKTELKKAENEVDSKSKEFSLIEKITITENQIEFEVPIREEPGKLNKYTFAVNGLYKSTVPIKTKTSSDSGTEKFFSSSDIDLTETLEYIEKAKSALKSPNGSFSKIIIKSKQPDTSAIDPKVVWTINVITDNQVGYARFDGKTGEFIEADKTRYGE